MPPITNTQQDAIDNTKITTDQLENPTPTPNLPTSNIPDISQYLTPSVAQTQELDTATQNRDVSLENLTSSMFGNETQGARTLGYEESAGIPRLQRELTDIENELRQTDINFRMERERIQNEPGLTVAQRNARLNDVSRKQASHIANLEVTRAARSGVLSDAQSFVQRKTELEFADEKARIDNLKFIYENNEGKYKDALGKVIKTEERAFDLAKSKYEKLETLKTTFLQNASLGSASNQVLSAIMSSKTEEELLKNAGKFVANPMELLQLAKAKKDIEKVTSEILAQKSGVLTKPLSGDASKVLSIATTVQPEIEKLKQVFSQSYKKSVKGIVLGTDRELVKLVDNVADKVGRLRSGGAINKEEETRFKRQIASFMDIPFGTSEGAITALNGILTEAQQVANGINPYESKLEDAVNDPLGFGVSITNTNPLGI